jgi:hypothetical protein
MQLALVRLPLWSRLRDWSTAWRAGWPPAHPERMNPVSTGYDYRGRGSTSRSRPETRSIRAFPAQEGVRVARDAGGLRIPFGWPFAASTPPPDN